MFECIIRLLENAKTEVRAFLSSYTLVITADNELIKAPRLAARARGVKLRYITEITNENIPYCNRQSTMVNELRHLDNIVGNFILSDSEFLSSPDVSPENPITEGYYSNVDKVLKLHRNVFETFWIYSIPAEIRIRQLQTGHGSLSRPPPTIICESKKNLVIDRFYICKECGWSSIFRDDAEKHSRISGHGKIKEFPIFD